MEGEKTDEKKPEAKKDILAEAREVAERNEKAVEEMHALVARNEELAARNILGGKSDAGIQPHEPKDLTPKEYKDAVMSGKIKFSKP